jgi:cytochrome c oxidase subunit 2
MTARRLLRAVTGLATSAGAVLTASIAAAAPQPGSGYGLPRDVSEHGHRIDWLMGVTNIITGVLFLIMLGWILYAAIGHNEKRHVAAHDHGTSRRSIFIVLGISGSIFFVVDGNLFFNSTTDLEEVFHNFEKVEHDPTTIRVEINAHQWAWDTRIAGPDGKFNTQDDIVTLNDLRIPVDTPVIFEVASTDVLHAFNLPNFRAKVDAVPGQVNRFWIQGKTVGEYEIGCAQHCGTNHYKMKGEITVLSKEDYARWADEASKNSARLFDENDKDAHWGWDWKGN